MTFQKQKRDYENPRKNKYENHVHNFKARQAFQNITLGRAIDIKLKKKKKTTDSEKIRISNNVIIYNIQSFSKEVKQPERNTGKEYEQN